MTSPGAERIEGSLRALLQRGLLAGIAAAYVFGSHADDRAHAESDLDLGILLDREAFPDRRARFERRLCLLPLLSEALRTEVDLVVLNDAPPELGRRIVTTGTRVLCTDAEAAHAYVRDVQLRAADLAPFLARMRKLKLQAIAR